MTSNTKSPCSNSSSNGANRVNGHTGGSYWVEEQNGWYEDFGTHGLVGPLAAYSSRASPHLPSCDQGSAGHRGKSKKQIISLFKKLCHFVFNSLPGSFNNIICLCVFVCVHVHLCICISFIAWVRAQFRTGTTRPCLVPFEPTSIPDWAAS